MALTTQLFTHVTLCKYHQECNAGERARTNLMSHTENSTVSFGNAASGSDVQNKAPTFAFD